MLAEARGRRAGVAAVAVEANGVTQQIVVDEHAPRFAAQRLAHRLHDGGGNFRVAAARDPRLRVARLKDRLEHRNELRAIAQSLPAERILLETDAPYLAPGRYRGKRNEPAYVVETAKVMAEARDVSLDAIARQTSENFFRLFRKVPPQTAGTDQQRS